MDAILKKMKTLDKGEREKLQKLLNEQTEPAEEEKMSWMYKEDKPEAEEYLLGRKIDKYIDEDENKMKEKNKSIPGATFDDELISRRMDLDMNTKMREDPLYAIKKREEDIKRRLLQNPIKMKQLQKKLDEQEEKGRKHKKKEKKEKKKSKKKSKRRDDSSDSEAEDILNQYLALVKQKKKQNSGHADDKSEKQYGLTERSHHKKKHSLPNSDFDHKQHSPPRQKYNRSRSPQGKGSKKEQKESSRRKHSESSSPDRKRSRSPKRRYSRSPNRRHSRSPHRRRSRSPYRRRSRSLDRHRSPRQHERSHHRSNRQQYKKVLTAEEKAARLAEMVENGKWREEMRNKNVKKYREEDEREETLSKQTQETTDAKEFINPLMSKHASESSVSDRIKRNIYKVQRTNADLEKAFTKR